MQMEQVAERVVVMECHMDAALSLEDTVEEHSELKMLLEALPM